MTNYGTICLICPGRDWAGVNPPGSGVEGCTKKTRDARVPARRKLDLVEFCVHSAYVRRTSEPEFPANRGGGGDNWIGAGIHHIRKVHVCAFKFGRHRIRGPRGPGGAIGGSRGRTRGVRRGIIGSTIPIPRGPNLFPGGGGGRASSIRKIEGGGSTDAE